MQVCSSSHASASEAMMEARSQSWSVEAVPVLEDDGSGIPSALAIDMPEVEALEGRYVRQSLRELPCVVAQEVQEI